MKKMLFDDYYKDIRKNGIIHIFIQQDFHYDEIGKFHLSNSFKVDIIKKGIYLYNEYVLFSSFADCKRIALEKCKEKGLKPEYIVFDKNARDYTVDVYNIDEIEEEILCKKKKN